MKKKIKNTSVLVSLLILVFVIVQQSVLQMGKRTANQSVTSESMNEQMSAQPSETETTTNATLTLQQSEDIVSENYNVKRGDTELYGVVTASRNYRNEKRPLLIISHGFNNTLEMYEEYANHFARMGFVVYRFDFYGGSKNSKSGGTDMLSMSVLTEKQDLSAVVAAFSKETFVNVDAISLLGASQGGVVSTLYAAENPNNVSNLILIFPAFVLFDDVKETYANLGVASTEQIPAVITHRNAQLGAIYLQDALGVNIDNEIKKVTSSVLIVQGTNDEVVPYQYAVNANQLFPNSELVTVEGGMHWIDNKFNQVAMPAIDQFLTK